MTAHYPGCSRPVNQQTLPPRQRELPWDEGTVCRTLQGVRPVPLRTLLRGLLLTAIRQPRTIADIDGAGYMLMTASVATVAANACSHPRTIQRARQAAAGVVDHDSDGHTDSRWFVRMADVLPSEAIAWLRDRIGEAEPTPCREADSGRTPGVASATPGVAFAARAGDKCRGDTEPPHLYMLSSNRASSAGLAEVMNVVRQHGYSAAGSTWDALRIDDQAITSPPVVAAIARAAMADGIIAAGDDAAYRVCVAAVVATTKNYPWSYLRGLLQNRQHMTTHATPAQIQQARRLCQQATGQSCSEQAGTAAGETADEAWARLLEAMKKHSYLYMPERQQIGAAVGQRIYAAAKAVGFERIANSTAYTERSLRAEFAAAWDAAKQSDSHTEAVRA